MNSDSGLRVGRDVALWEWDGVMPVCAVTTDCLHFTQPVALTQGNDRSIESLVFSKGERVTVGRIVNITISFSRRQL